MRKDQEIYNVIDTILWEDWDPIGINDNPQIQDEYSDYVPQIVKLVKNNADVFKINKQLVQFTNVNLGIGPVGEKAFMDIAKKIKDLTQPFLG